MNNIENDEMLKELAKHVGVDLNNLEPEDDYEKKEIELAHEICGLPYDEIAHFLSRVEIPEFISPQWIFKALNCNDEFYIQNLALIRATEWMRQEVYAKEKENPYVLDFPFGKLEEPIPDECILMSAGPANGRYSLPKCYNGDTDYEIRLAVAEPSKENKNDWLDIDIHIETNNPDAFDKRNFCLKTLTRIGKVEYSSKYVKLENLDGKIRRFYVTNVPKDKLLGHAWILSYNEEV